MEGHLLRQPGFAEEIQVAPGFGAGGALRCEEVQGNFQIADVVPAGFRQAAGVHIDLDALEYQLRQGESLVPFGAELDEILLAARSRKLDVALLFLPDGAFIFQGPPPGLVIVANENPRLIRKHVEPLRDGAVHFPSGTSGKVAAARAAVVRPFSLGEAWR